MFGLSGTSRELNFPGLLVDCTVFLAGHARHAPLVVSKNACLYAVQDSRKMSYFMEVEKTGSIIL